MVLQSKFLCSVGGCNYLRYRTKYEVEIQYVNLSDTCKHYIGILPCFIEYRSMMSIFVSRRWECAWAASEKQNRNYVFSQKNLFLGNFLWSLLQKIYFGFEIKAYRTFQF